MPSTAGGTIASGDTTPGKTVVGGGADPAGGAGLTQPLPDGSCPRATKPFPEAGIGYRSSPRIVGLGSAEAGWLARELASCGSVRLVGLVGLDRSVAPTAKVPGTAALPGETVADPGGAYAFGGMAGGIVLAQPATAAAQAAVNQRARQR